MNQHVAAADRLPLPPVTPRSMRSVSTDHATPGQSRLLPPFLPGQRSQRWSAPAPSRPSQLAAAAPGAPATPRRLDDEVPTATPPLDPRMPWETATSDAAAGGASPDTSPTPEAEQTTDSPEPATTPQTAQPAAAELWDPSLLWDDAPVSNVSTGVAVPAEEPRVAAADSPVPDSAPVSDEPAEAQAGYGLLERRLVTERVATRLETLAAEVRISGLAALGAADDSDELSRLLAGVITGFLARDNPHE
jgi:hypothetical protein